MGKTEIIIRVSINHDSPKAKHVALNMWCDGLKEGQECKGISGAGEEYTLKVTNINERTIKP